MIAPAGSDDHAPAAPLLRVVKGDPTDEELAALVAVVTALGAAQVRDDRPPRSEWSAAHRAVRTVGSPLPVTWRSSALPR